jgi:hypothetical protein
VSARGDGSVVSALGAGVAELALSAELPVSAAACRSSPVLEQPEVTMINELNKSAGARPGNLELTM